MASVAGRAVKPRVRGAQDPARVDRHHRAPPLRVHDDVLQGVTLLEREPAMSSTTSSSGRPRPSSPAPRELVAGIRAPRPRSRGVHHLAAAQPRSRGDGEQGEVDRFSLPHLRVGRAQRASDSRDPNPHQQLIPRRTVFQIPSATKKSLTGTERVPSADSQIHLCTSVMRTGGVSAECAATHFLPTLVTWQTSPSFFRQKPSACRQKSDWL
jgi:hypothetical protein